MTGGNFFSEWLWRRPAAFLGFKKTYNWPLFFIFAGALFGFSLARLEYLSPRRYKEGSSPGEWYWQRSGYYRVGFYLHLGAILPVGLLIVWQFVPKIRQRALLFHRINGWLLITLILISHAGALMILRRAFGGDLAMQGVSGLAVIMTTISLALAVYNVKKLQIDQHRAWMLRMVFYLSFIITFRIIMIIAAMITSAVGSYSITMTCGEIDYINEDKSNSTYVSMQYPQCVGADSSTPVAVIASFFLNSAENVGASLRLNSGTAGFLALFLHAVGVEIYLRLTPRESERLRQVSATRQMEAGYENPGSAGLVVEKFGDANPWQSREEQVSSVVKTDDPATREAGRD